MRCWKCQCRSFVPVGTDKCTKCGSPDPARLEQHLAKEREREPEGDWIDACNKIADWIDSVCDCYSGLSNGHTTPSVMTRLD